MKQILEKLSQDLRGVRCTLQTVTDPTEVTYEELVALIDSQSLVEGAQYLVTDYQTLHIMANTTDRNDTNAVIPVEPLMVVAATNDSLYPEAFQPLYPNDLIYYDVTGDYLGSLKPTGHKGAITRRINLDNKIDTPFDYRNWYVRRWSFDFSVMNPDLGVAYLLPTTSYTQGQDSSGSEVTYTAIDVGDYEDMKSIGGLSAGNNQDNLYNILLEDKACTNVLVDCPDVRGFYLKQCTWWIPNQLNIKAEEVHHAVFEFVEDTTFYCKYLKSINSTSLGSFWNSTILISPSTYQSGTPIVRDLQTVTITSEDVGNYGLVGWGEVSETRNTYVNVKLGAFGSWSGGLKAKINNCARLRITIDSSNDYSRQVIRSVGSFSGSTINMYDDSQIDSFEDIQIIETKSNLKCTVPTTTDLAIAANSPLHYAGEITFDGAGSTSLATLTRHISNRIPKILKPVSGLTLQIPTNNVANGFVNSATVTANGTNGEVIFIEPVGDDQWIAYN